MKSYLQLFLGFHASSRRTFALYGVAP